MDESWHVTMAERAAELVNETETKKEEDYYWKQYRYHMKVVCGEDIFRKKPQYNNKPSKALIKTVLTCSCGSTKFGWERKEGLVRFSCPNCDRKTGFYEKNSLARNEWNESIEKEKE